ncbi:hypothetical protein [Emcibacter nanhaiensis]|uniref:Uncharacterized protein n=1 Tax=Emcibacter nanhaiensis TaxID=1505037 RepID=A0A501PRB3_9PROT|nr:hypothetical protein [Emcibacter nanhaiensis]TPD62993.1 hypothetical protein FIV46_02630 [Emcibacter nanhaiensis]
MVVPLIGWGLFALGTALGIGGTVATTDAAEDIGDAVEKSSNSLNKLMVTTAIVGAGFMYARHKKWV